MNDARPIEYLNRYREALEHQRAHNGDIVMSIYPGMEQPQTYCLACLRENPTAAPAEPLHDVKLHWSWAIPTEATLAVIAEFSPNGVVEIGAGGGYWAKLLRERGVDVIAYDVKPGDPHWFRGGELFSEVLECDHTAVIGHPDRTLFLCWPSYGLAWTHEVLELYEGDTVIYIGEGPGGCTGTDRMHALLGHREVCYHPDDGERCETCDVKPLFEPLEREWPGVPQWLGLHDRLTVYTRIPR